MSRIIVPGRRGDGENVTGDHNAPYIEVVDAGHVSRAKQQMRIANIIGAALVKAYNNRQWKVIVDVKQGMLVIACDSVSNDKGYHIHMKGHSIRYLRQRAVFAAGEILERHALSRAKNFDADIIETLPRDLRDNVIGPDSAPEPING